MRLFFALLLLSFTGRGQELPPPHGTLIVAVICEDGVILAADSRASFTGIDVLSNKEIPIAYIQQCRKIYKLGGFQVAITGSSNIGNDYWTKIIHRYNKKHKSNPTLDGEFADFKKYLNQVLNINDSIIFRNRFVLAGYENGNPKIAFIDSSGYSSASKINRRLFTHNCIKDTLRSVKIFTCDKVKKILTGGFNYCSSIDKSIGGPNYIIQIKRDNSIKELTAVKFKEYKNYKSFLRSIVRGKTKLTYIFPEDKQTLMSNIRLQLKKSKQPKE